MAAVKMNFSFDTRTAELLRQRAAEQGKPASRYVAELVEADVRSAQDILAIEGYRALSADNRAFAEETAAAGAENWPEW